MKLTKNKLKQIIKEELQSIMQEEEIEEGKVDLWYPVRKACKEGNQKACAAVKKQDSKAACALGFKSFCPYKPKNHKTA
jgi:aspartyl aminopeptidase